MNPSYAYALARMHARVALRPGEAARRRLTAVGDFGHFLQAAASAGYAVWLARLGPTSAVHTVELALGLAYRAQLDEIADWLPESWRPVTAWLELAPGLPVLGMIVEQREPPDWVRDDPLFAPLFPESGGGKPDAEAVVERWPELASESAGELGNAWLDEACRRVPGRSGSIGRSGNEPVARLLRFHVESPNDPIGAAEIERFFRRAPELIVRVLAYLALVRRDLDFLRGELAVRRLRADFEHDRIPPGEAA